MKSTKEQLEKVYDFAEPTYLFKSSRPIAGKMTFVSFDKEPLLSSARLEKFDPKDVKVAVGINQNDGSIIWEPIPAGFFGTYPAAPLGPDEKPLTPAERIKRADCDFCRESVFEYTLVKSYSGKRMCDPCVKRLSK